jgi:hypothetical protein
MAYIKEHREYYSSIITKTQVAVDSTMGHELSSPSLVSILPSCVQIWHSSIPLIGKMTVWVVVGLRDLM